MSTLPMSDPTQKEQAAFSQRFVEALVKAGLSTRQADVWKAFNQMHAGPDVSIHAVRKWLVGESIPTQDKLRTIAEWLSVPLNWLRFGDEFVDEKSESLRSSEWSMIDDFRCLTDQEKERLRSLIRVMASSKK